MRQRIGIVGTGISGLSAAWALHRDHDIVVFEKDSRLGGHSNTVEIATATGTVPVDTGFIVYNETTYPNLTRLFAHLGVPTEPSNMSFAYSLDGRFEYGASARGVLGRPGNLGSRRFRLMLRDINRFRRRGNTLRPHPGETIDDLLVRHGFSDGFRDDYLFPMAGAIWSARQSDIRSYPAATILRFLANHGLIEIIGRPHWRTVSGGSREYVRRLTQPFADRIKAGCAVERVVRNQESIEIHTAGHVEVVDHVVLATHSDDTLRLLGDGATPAERSLLGAIRYQRNVAVLHSDIDLMPRRRGIWSSWNAMAWSDRGSGTASVSYWMNRLQNLETPDALIVSLNPLRQPRTDLVHASFEYAHPQFDQAAIDAQQGIASLQGKRNTWFAGAYLGYGFHEDGLQSGLDVAAALGSPAPWDGSFDRMSSVIAPANSGEPR